MPRGFSRRTPSLRPLALSTVCACASAIFPVATRADIYRWDNGQVIPGTDGIVLGPTVNLSGWSTAPHVLQYANLSSSNLTSANFVNSDLSNATFHFANVGNANFTNASIQGADFSSATGPIVSQLVSTGSYQKRNFSGINLEGHFLPGANLTSQNFSNANLSYCNLSNAILFGANMTGANLSYASLTPDNINGANFSNATITGADFSQDGITFNQLSSTASYKQMNLAAINCYGTNMTGWNLSGQNLSHASLYATNLTNANFIGANLSNATLGSTVTGANFSNAIIQGASFPGSANFTYSQLTSTASFQQANLTGLSLNYLDVSGWDFTGQNLSGGNFQYTTLTNANFSNVTIQGADFLNSIGFTTAQLFSTASYKQKNLSGIYLTGMDLTGVDLSGQNLANSVFNSLQLTNANLAGSIFTSVSLQSVTLTNANFSNATLDCTDFRATVGFSAAGAASINGTIFPDGTIPVLNLTNGQRLLINANYNNVHAQITAGTPTVGAGATLLNLDKLSGADIVDNGNISLQSGSVTTLGNISGTGNLALTSNATAIISSIHLASLSMGGALTITPNSRTSVLSTFSWTSSPFSLDLTNNMLILENAASHSATLSLLQTQVAYGRTHASGIRSSTLSGNQSLAVLDNAVTQFTTFGGIAVDAGSILIATELLGDANADGTIDLTDLSTVLNNFGTTTPSWTSGNFDGQPTIDLTDLSYVLNNFGLANPNAFSQDSALSPPSSLPTPEPTALALLFPALLFLRHSRSRHQRFNDSTI